MNTSALRKGLKAALATLLVLGPASAAAATIPVNSFIDNGVGCTLRKAVANANAQGAANADCTAGTAGSNTIVLGAGGYQVTGGPITFGNGTFVVQGAGPDQTQVDGMNNSTVFETGFNNNQVAFSDMTITRGFAQNPIFLGGGGAIHAGPGARITVTRMGFFQNVSGTNGGGGAINNEGRLDVSQSYFRENQVQGGTGGGGGGGAILNTGNMTITRSAFELNTASQGGAVYNRTNIAITRPSIDNSTFWSNSAGRGGAISDDGGNVNNRLVLASVTITQNNANHGGGFSNNQGGAIVSNSIIAGNTSGDGPDCQADVPIQSSYSVFGSVSACARNSNGLDFVGDALLTSPAENGYFLPTAALQPYSPARDRVPTCAGTDQRGVARPSPCDAGAFEADPTRPQAPINVAGTLLVRTQNVRVNFIPTNDGGAPVSNYIVTTVEDPSINVTGNASPITVFNLTVGQTYTFRVRALNIQGISDYSQPSNGVKIMIGPSKPLNVRAIAGNGQAFVAWDAPGTDSGTPVAGYSVYLNGNYIGSPMPPTSRTFVATGLVNGQSYAFQVDATNFIDLGPKSDPSNAVVPASNAPPTIPRDVVATAGNAQVTLTFTGSEYNGGSAINFYSINCGGVLRTTLTSPITVSPLPNGTPVTCTIAAVTSAATGPTATSNNVTPVGPPGAPTIGAATAGNASASVTFTAPASNGGSPITGYTVTASPGGLTATGAASPLVVNSLVNGTPYTFTVTATNGVGTGAASAASNAVTPKAPTAAKRADLNGDGKGDLIFQDAAGNIAAWTMDGTGILNASGLLPAGSGWSVTQVADFNGDGKADIMLRHADGRVMMWLMDGLAVSNQILLQNAGSGWRITHAADMNGDGKADLLWEHTDGTVFMTLMDGGTAVDFLVLQPAGSGWHVTHMADLNGDGNADLLWQHNDGTTVAWLMNGKAFLGSAGFTPAGSGWSITRTGDVNGDGKADLAWRNTSGAVMLWVMDGTTLLDFAALQLAGSPWRIDLIGDLDGDGKGDLIWRNSSDGSTFATLMNGVNTLSAGYLMGGASGWTATHLLDLNGDGKQDILWRYTDGTLATWIMNGLGPTAAAGLIGPSTWQIVPPAP